MQTGRGPRAAAGFTLLELLVALGVASLVGAAALAGWREINAALTLDRAVHQVAADVQSTRVLAIASASRARLVFTSGTGRYRRERTDDGGTFRVQRRIELPRGIAIADVNSGGDLTFSGRGDGENGTVSLVDARGVVRRVRLNQRGRITVLAVGE